MSSIGDFFDALGDAVTGSSPPQSAPVPTVTGNPRPYRAQDLAVRAWIAPDASGSGQFMVHRDVLHSVAKGMLSDIRDLDEAIATVRGAGGAFGSLRGWAIGNAFAGNGESACHGFAQAATQAGDAQNAASKGLSDTASSYDAAEEANRQAIGQVGAQLDASGGSVSAAGGI